MQIAATFESTQTHNFRTHFEHACCNRWDTERLLGSFVGRNIHLHMSALHGEVHIHVDKYILSDKYISDAHQRNSSNVSCRSRQSSMLKPEWQRSQNTTPN